ncbi:hypothetical protein [Streptomyces sp. NPDC127098]|uniref:hypothetical protein n=1 Tax=Streptomyces sp. NPDC127098 TaxID=3347137 RepID=UPI00365EB355
MMNPRRNLPIAISLLLPENAPSRWGDSVARAGQLLQPAWPVDPSHLTALAYIVYSTASSDRRAPAEVSPSDVLEAIGAAVDAPDSLAQSIKQSLIEAGHEDDFVGRQFSKLSALEYFEEFDDFSCTPPGPSLLARALPRLAIHLESIRAEELPPGPAPAGPFSLSISGLVHVVGRYGSMRGTFVLRCEVCQESKKSLITVRGPDVVIACNAGHVHRSPHLSAVHVRRAAAAHGQLALLAEATASNPVESISVKGDLEVAVPSMPEDADPTTVMPWAAANRA